MGLGVSAFQIKTTNWGNRAVTNPQSEKSVIISPYKPMTQTEYDKIKADEAAERAFKVQELLQQAKKAGISGSCIELLKKEPDNCKINPFKHTMTYVNGDEKTEFAFKNGKLAQKTTFCKEYGLDMKYVEDYSNMKDNGAGYRTVNEYEKDSNGKYHLTGKSRIGLVNGDVKFGKIAILESWHYYLDGSLREHNKNYDY